MKGLRLFLILMLAVGITALALPTQAQDNTAVVEAALEALLSVEDYTSYTSSSFVGQSANIEVFIGGESALSQQSTDNTEDVTTFVADGSLGNVLTITSASSTQTENGEMIIYNLDAETRIVDGVIYVSAAYEEADATLPALPEGWIELTSADLETYPGLDRLGFDTALTAQEEGTQIPFTNNYEALSEALLTGTTTAIESPDSPTTDGRTGLGYTLILDAEGVALLLAATPNIEENQVLGAMIDALDDTSTGFFSIVVDEDGLVMEASVTVTAIVTDLDVAAIDPNVPPGTTANISLILSNTTTLNDINGDLELTEAPTE
jgi:hypothetical protein